MRFKSILLVSWVNFLLNTAVMGSMIFISLLGARLGASDFQVGVIGATYGLSYLLSSIYSGRQSDRRGKLRFVRVGLLLCTVSFAAQLLASNLIILALVRAGVGLSLGITMAALVAYAFESGADMGKFSSYGSLGWIAGSLTSAGLKEFHYIFVVGALSCATAFLLSLFFAPETGPTSHQESKTSLRFGAVVKRGFPIYLAVFFRHLGATSVWVILPLYFTSLGLGPFWLGILWGTNFTVQFIVMRYLDRFNPHRAFAIGQIVSIMVFVAYVILKPVWPLLIAQALLGVAWACLYVGALLLILQAGEDRGTASGIFQAVLNFCATVGPFLGGLIAQGWGYRGVFFFAAALGVAGMAVAVPQTIQRSEGV
ncbi:MAG: MFS transporter [Clostridia bacterium]|nr:MFS transporter [Clostridia bacterium]